MQRTLYSLVFRGGVRWLRVFPRRSGDARLAKDDGEESDADIARMRVGYRQDEVAASHELMAAAGVRFREAEPPERSDQLSTPVRTIREAHASELGSEVVSTAIADGRRSGALGRGEADALERELLETTPTRQRPAARRRGAR
jgi:hypothetical protein